MKVTKKTPVAVPAKSVTKPTHFLVEALKAAKFKFVKTEKNVHGYQHGNGMAVLVDPRNGWVLRAGDGRHVEGKTEKEFKSAHYTFLHPDEVAVPKHVLSAVLALRKATKGTYRIADLAGDGNYGVRMALLKTLRKDEKVLAKDTGVNNLTKEFYAALATPNDTHAGMAAKFAARCNAVHKADARETVKAKKADAEQRQEDLGRTLHQRVIHDGKPLLPKAKKLTQKQRGKQKEALRQELAIKARIAREESANLAIPRPDAAVAVDLANVTLLENPDNGIVLLCLEKANSQGAICVYNNGSRVAAGVVPTEVLSNLRPLISTDLVRDVNQLLNPLSSSVVVTPVAASHLTAVLEACKELLPMPNETVKTKKFEAPKKSTAAKKVATKAEKTPAKKAATADGAERVKVVANPDAVVKLVKNPPEGVKLAKRDRVIVEILQANGKSLSLAKLLKEMGKKIETAGRTMESVWAWHGSPRQALLSEGILKVSEA